MNDLLIRLCLAILIFFNHLIIKLKCWQKNVYAMRDIATLK